MFWGINDVYKTFNENIPALNTYLIHYTMEKKIINTCILVPKDKDVKPIYILFVIPVILLPVVVTIVYWKCRNSESK